MHDGWIYDSLAEGNIREELNSTASLIRAIQQREDPSQSSHERRIEALSPAERDAYQQATQEANRAGVAAPQAQQVATAAVAEIRGEYVDSPLTPQAVIDARTEERVSPDPSATAHLQEQRTSAPAAPTSSEPAQRARESTRSEAPGQEPTAAIAPLKGGDTTEQKARTNATAPSHQAPPAGASALPMGNALQSFVQEQDARQAPIQSESNSPGSVTQSEPVEPPLQGALTTPVVAREGRPHSQPPVEAQTALPSGETAYQQPQAPPTPLLFTQPSHPDHALYQQIRDGVAALDARHGRSFDATSERMTASLLVLAKDNDLDRVDHVLLSNATPDKAAGHSLFVVQGEPGDPAHQRAAMPTALAAQTPVAESMQQFDAVSREAQHRAQDNQLEQQLNDQRVQQSIQSRAASIG